MVSVSITALHDPVSIIHVPVSGSALYSSRVYWTIDRAAEDSSEFFNLTSNRIEIALFASVDLVEDEWGSLTDGDSEVKINGPWRVFEISSGESDDHCTNDSPHLRHVSAPLAAAGVSILYQSSYFTDFLLVKAEDFERASKIFKAHGWNVDPLAPPVRRRSIHVAPEECIGYMPALPPTPPPPPIAEITVLSSPLACVGLSRDTEGRNSERLKKYLVWPERAFAALQRERGDGELGSPGSPRPSREQRRPSYERRPSPPRPFISYTRTEDGASVLTEVRVLRAMFNRPEDQGDLLSAGELDRHSESGDWTTAEDSSDEESDMESTPSSCSSLSQTSPRRHGHSLPGTPKDLLGTATFTLSPIPVHWASTSASGSSSAVTTPTTATPRYSFGLGVGVSGMTPIYPTHSRTQSESDRTARVLDGLPRPRRASEGNPQKMEPFEEPREPPEEPRVRTMRCLQLDLRAVGNNENVYLEKSGIVTRFSSVLQKGGVRMLFSSTTHTANLLVQGADVWKAEELLRVNTNSNEKDASNTVNDTVSDDDHHHEI